MNRLELIAKLQKRLEKAHALLVTYKYTNAKDWLFDLNVLENTQKEIEIQKAYLDYEQ